MINIDRGSRVFVSTGEDQVEAHAIFVCVTPANDVIFSAPETGREWRVPLEAVNHIEVARIICPDCQAEHNVDRLSARCADCERQHAYKQPKPSETCEECGKLGAVYSPLAKRFLDLQCLAKGGFLTGLGVEARVVTQGAICRSDDIHSLRHDWRRTKSSFVCTECKSKVFEKPAGYASA